MTNKNHGIDDNKKNDDKNVKQDNCALLMQKLQEAKDKTKRLENIIIAEKAHIEKLLKLQQALKEEKAILSWLLIRKKIH